ncbi:MAG TPA: LuxR C-terminal-related transcriptional regulator [Candidatus Olsenella pullicola]|nr:LuxR C-terminal-related transcriptional regulator [Candidatus Olsenella pullicola]
MQARRTLRMFLWVLWGAVLVAAPAGTYYLKFCSRLSSMGVSCAMSPLDFAWSSSLPLSVLAAALAYVVVDRLRRHARPIVLIAAVCGVAYVASLFFELSLVYGNGGLGSVPYGFYRVLAGVQSALRYASMLAWAATGVLWGTGGSEKAEKSGARTPFEELADATGLTDREYAVAQGLLAGHTQAQIAQALSISASSVATYRARACQKLGIASLDELDPVVPADKDDDVIDVRSPLVPGLLVVGFCGAKLLGLLVSSFSAANALLVLAILILPPVIVLAVARARRLRPWVRPSMAPRCAFLCGAVALQGLLLGGLPGTSSPVISIFGFVSVDINWLGVAAMVGYPLGVLWLASAALLPKDDVAEGLLADEDRCVLYLRGRGLGELEARVVTWIASGAGTQLICSRLHVAPGTVNAYRARAYARLGVHSSRELAELLARDVGVVPSAGKNVPSAESSETGA